MMSFRLLAVPLVGLALLGAAGGANSPDAAITTAAVAPYRDELARDAPALCSDLTRPPVIVPSPSPGASCEEAVEGIFAGAAAPTLPADVVASLEASASHLEVDGKRATGIFSLTALEPGTEHGIPGTAIVALGSYRLSLEEVAGRWLVSSPARLAAIGDCQLKAPGHCQTTVKDLLFMLGDPVTRTFAEELPIPPAVKRAGRRERREFAAGATTLAQSGCLACHRIGAEGNHGPGQNLTHVGARLSSRQIEHALLSPRAPMPSFKNLPGKKLHLIVRFLSLLR
jgi:mono/diheme cytochrome c family protein